ncbi:S-layer homology domain-containing protein [Geosporobacter ferrireducens]|uniref:SLH domain-containing protein n=1 Tax=Geosporobacter ferrireducens TaxID=1424294 RepID=A0A1D8GH39_9FIRM|nr:S-layer homology domain-containing protein [Geosporobacter ferrireducens]AOT70219.1 hypothetical protein Gferi_11810 [Geosporobacter ferrireducens]
MKKMISFLLVLTLLLSVAMIPGYAYSGKDFTPPGLAKKGGIPPGISKFIDLKEVEWARNAIEKMADKGILKGIAEDKFAPNKPVTKAEALAMILRALGYEEEVQKELTAIKEGKKKSKLKDAAQEWALGYIAVAKDGKILADEEELTWKNLNKPAQRQEVAKYIVRALEELYGEIGEYKGALPFKDANAIKTAYREYVGKAYAADMMKGDNNNNFQPNKAVTRAEMAVLVEKLDDYDGKPVDGSKKIIEGKLIRIIDNSELVIRVNGVDREYDISKNVKVYIDNRLKDLEDLERNKTIEITVKDGKVIEIRWNSDTVIVGDVYEGRITAINSTDKKISVENGNIERLFTITNDTQIKINGETTTFSKLVVGMDVKITVKDEKVRLVEGTNSAITYKGAITDINWNTKEVTLRIGNVARTYRANENTVVRIDGSSRSFDRLDTGMEADIKVAGNILQEISARNVRENLSGTLTAINRSIKEITIKSGNTERSLKVNSDAVIKLDDQVVTLNDLMPKMEVEVVVNNDKVDRIDAYAVESQYRGELVEKYMGNPYRLVLKSNGQNKTYNVDRNVTIIEEDDDDDIKFKDLVLGSQIKITVVNETVVKIVVED